MEEENEVFRPLFIENLKRYKDENIIKILYGVRRCGKSTILKAYKTNLLAMGVKAENIIERKYTSMEYQDDFDNKSMYDDLISAIKNAYGRDGIVIRAYEKNGRNENCRFSVKGKYKKGELVTALEDPIEEINLDSVSFKPFEIKTIWIH